MGRELLWSYLFIFPYVHLFYQYLSLRHGVYYSISLLSKCNFTFFSKKDFHIPAENIYYFQVVMYFIYKNPTRTTRPSGKKYFTRISEENIWKTHKKYFTLRGQMLRVPPPMWCVYNPSALELLNTTYVEQIQINQIFTLDHN